MAGTIKVSLAVDGESKFKKAISDSEKSIKNMSSRLTLATAEFKRDGDAMKLVQERSETLRKEIQQQEEIVKALEGAVADATGKYGENSAQTEHWEAQLNKAKATLANMQTELSNNEQGLDKNGRAFVQAADDAGELTDALEDVDSAAGAVNFSAIDTAISNLQSSLKTAMTAVAKFAKGAWTTVVDSSNWADDLLTYSQELKVPVEELQGWEYAARFVDTEVDTIARAMSRLANPTKSITEALAGAGVSVRDAGNQMRDKEDIFWDTIDVLSKMTDSAEQDALASEIFGKKFSEMQPLINAGREAWEGYVKEAQEAGIVLSEEQVGQLGTFNDSIQKLDASISAMKNNISAELAPAFKQIADAFSDIVTKFNLWSQSAEGQKALGDLNAAISAVVTTITENTDFSSLAETAAGAISGLGDALGKIANDPSGIIAAVGGALAAYAGLTITKEVLSVLQLISSFKGAATGAGAAVSSAAGAVGSFLAPALPAVGLAATVMGVSMALDDLAKERDWGWTKELTNLSAGISPEGVAAIKAGIELGISEGIEAAATAESISEAIKTKWAEGMKTFESFLTEDSVGGKAFSEGEKSKMQAWVEEALGEDVKAAQQKAHEMWQSVYDAAIGKGFTPEEATEEADNLLKDNPLVKTVKELESTKDELDKAMTALYKAGNHATEEEIAKVQELMGKVQELQAQLGILQADTAGYGANSYETVRRGGGTVSNIGAAIGWVESTNAQALAKAQEEMAKAEQEYASAFAGAGDDTEKQAEAVAAYEEKVAELNATMEEANTTKAQQLMDIVNGAASGMAGAEDFEATVDQISALADVLSYLEEGGDIRKYDENGWDLGYTDMIQNALDMIGKGGEDLDAWGVIQALNGAMEAAMSDLNSQAPGMMDLLSVVQSIIDTSGMEGLDLSTITGPFAAALKSQMIMAAAGEDGMLTIDELMGAISSEDFRTIGANAMAGAEQGVNDGKGSVVSSVSEAGTEMISAMEAATEEKSPSKATRRIGKYFMQGAQLGIAEGMPAAVSAALSAGSAISGAFASGMESNLSRIQAAVNRMAAIAAQVGSISVGGWSGGPGSYTITGGRTSNNSLYIGSFNSYSNQDVEGLMNSMDNLRESRNAGYGA